MIEYDILKKILYVTLPLAVAMTIFTTYVRDYIPPANAYLGYLDKINTSIPFLGILIYEGVNLFVRKQDFFVYMILYPLQFLSFLIVYATLFRIIVQVIRKDFRYYFAKSCFRIGVENHDEIQTVRYLIEGLNSYDKYLKRRFDFQIKDLKNVQQKIACTDSEAKDKLLKSLSEETSNKLDLIKKLSDFLYLIYPEDLLGSQQFRVKIAEITPILAALIIPIIVAIIQLYGTIITH